MSGPTFSVEQLKALKSIGVEFKVNPHGDSGLFGIGVMPDMPVAIPRARSLAASLPWFPSYNENHIFEIFTGISAATGDNPTSACGTPPVAGELKTCQIKLPFGKFFMATTSMNATDANKRRNIADINRRMQNNPFTPRMSPFTPMLDGRAPDVNTILGKKMIELGDKTEKAFVPVMIQGNRTLNNTQTQRGFISEPEGLDRLIKTGHTDEQTDTACAGADSIVVTGGAWDADEMAKIINLYREQRTRAGQVGMPNTMFEIVINPRVKYELYDTWACNFSTFKCANTAGEFDLTAMEMMKREMMRGSYVLIDGDVVPVREDDGMPLAFDASANTYTGDVHIVPRWNDGEPLLFGEYLPYVDQMPRFGDVQDMLNSVEGLQIFNDGMYLGGQIKSGAYCGQVTLYAETRLILMYPFLAGRVDDIVFTPSVGYRNPLTYDGGGVTTRTS